MSTLSATPCSPKVRAASRCGCPAPPADPTAWQAADALAARLTGREVPETTIGYNFQCISLGRRDGIIQPVTPDDQAKSTAITGRAAARIKEFICAGAAWGIGHPTLMLPSRRRHIAATGVAETASSPRDAARARIPFGAGRRWSRDGSVREPSRCTPR